MNEEDINKLLDFSDETVREFEKSMKNEMKLPYVSTLPEIRPLVPILADIRPRILDLSIDDDDVFVKRVEVYEILLKSLFSNLFKTGRSHSRKGKKRERHLKKRLKRKEEAYVPCEQEYEEESEEKHLDKYWNTAYELVREGFNDDDIKFIMMGKYFLRRNLADYEYSYKEIKYVMNKTDSIRKNIDREGYTDEDKKIIVKQIDRLLTPFISPTYHVNQLLYVDKIQIIVKELEYLKKYFDKKEYNDEENKNIVERIDQMIEDSYPKWYLMNKDKTHISIEDRREIIAKELEYLEKYLEKEEYNDEDIQNMMEQIDRRFEMRDASHPNWYLLYNDKNIISIKDRILIIVKDIEYLRKYLAKKRIYFRRDKVFHERTG